MSLSKRGKYWWYEFIFAGRRVRESSKSPSKTVAKVAEQQRKRELEEGFNNFTDNRRERVRTIADLADEYLTAYKLRHPQSAVFAEYAVNHVCRILGSRMFVDCNEATVTLYQNQRLKESAAPKSVNEEIGFLLRLMGDPGDLLRQTSQAQDAQTQGRQVDCESLHGWRKRRDAGRSEEGAISPHLSRHHARPQRRNQRR